MYMIHYYLERGHSVKELMNLTPLEKQFFIASMGVTAEENAAIVKGVEKIG
nr:MAG TPA: hypothetical protein [Caudoviricetes sp.]